MTSTISDNQISEKKQGNNYAYPMRIAEIPFASFMRIHKFSYDEAMKTVAKEQNDVLGTFQNSGLAKILTDGIADAAQFAYGSNTRGKELMSKISDPEGLEQAIKNVRFDTANSLSPGNMDGKIAKDERTREEILNTKFEVGNGWGAGKTEVTLQELLDQKNDAKNFHEQGYIKNYCDLAMPNEFTYDYGANWNNTFKLGTMALAADDPSQAAKVLASGALIGGGSAAITKKLGKKDEFSALIAEGAKNGMDTAGNLFGVNSNILDPTNVVGMAGLAPNENAIQFFKKMEFRKFELNFEFASRSDKESREIQEILTWFKHGMHPVSKNPDGGGSGVLLGFPDVWRLEPRFTPAVDEKGKYEPEPDMPHPMMPQTKLCALVGMRVNTTPFGSFSTIFDGTIPLITMTLTFNELTALTRADFMTNKYL